MFSEQRGLGWVGLGRLRGWVVAVGLVSATPRVEDVEKKTIKKGDKIINNIA